MTPEGKIKAYFKRRLTTLSPRLYSYWPVPMGMGATTLDCLLCVNGFFVAIENKKENSSALTPRQQDTRQNIIDAGGIVILVNSKETADHAVALIASLIHERDYRLEGEQGSGDPEIGPDNDPLPDSAAA